MSQQQPAEAGDASGAGEAVDARDARDELRVEISDARAGAGGHEPAAALARSPLAPRGTPRQRTMRGALTLAGVVLVAVLVLASLPEMRQSASALLSGLIPTPAPTLTPDEYEFYLLPNPPGVEVALDGAMLRRVPLPGDPHPLRLGPGKHTFSWRSHLLPFEPLQCTISVPAREFDTCPTVTSLHLQQSGLQLPGTVLALHESLISMAAQGADLGVKIQQALYAARSTTILRAGESYYSDTLGQAGGPILARQSLRATLSYQYLNGAGFPEPCELAFAIIPCRFLGQDCTQICTVPAAAQSLTGVDAAHEWVTAVEVHASWQYATLDGHIIAQDIPESFGIQLMVLRITWDGAAWHVTPVFGHTPGMDVADDAVCDPARYWLGGTTWSFMLNDPPPGEHALFASDTNPADGCVVVLEHGGPAVFLERFGLLLTVNDAARNPVDSLPVADASEQQVAQRLMAQLPPATP